MQADPFVQSPKNSQSLNRYTYVLNNPLSYTDPSGYFIKELVNFVAAVVRVIYAWEDPYAWAYLAAATKNLLNANGSQQSAVPTGAMAGAFTNGFTTAASINSSGVQHRAVQETGSPSDRVRATTIGGTRSDQTGWKFANGGDTQTFAYVIAIGLGETTISWPAGGFIDFLYAGARILPALSGGTITVLTGGILYPSGLLDDPLTHPSFCPGGCSGSIYPGSSLDVDLGATIMNIDKAGTAEIGDKVLTPDDEGFEGDRLRGGQGIRNRDTGEIWQKDRAINSGTGPHGGSKWKVGNRPGELPSRGNKTTVAEDGTVLKRDP